MKLRKFIPITSVMTIAASFAPIGLTSCSKFHNIDISNGYTPATQPISERMFESYEEACQYYMQLDSNILADDYLWSLGEYVKENLEFPEPIFPFKFTKIEQAIISLENWFTQPYQDTSKKTLFYTSYSIVLRFAGQTESRKSSTDSVGSYLPNSYCVVSLTTQVNKLPYTLKNKSVGTNKTDARWYLTPAEDDVLKQDDQWTISSTAQVTYKRKESYDQMVTTVDTLGAYWHKDNLYDPEKDPDKSYLYPFIYDAIVYGSYHLMNCTLKNE